jgi:hypothetical protein
MYGCHTPLAGRNQVTLGVISIIILLLQKACHSIQAFFHTIIIGIDLVIAGLDLAKTDALDFRDYAGCDCILATCATPIDLHKENARPDMFRKIARFSSLTMSLMITCFVSVIDDKKYLSALVADKGCIKGVSDMISAQPFYRQHELNAARARRIYLTSQGRIGVIIDGDIKSPDCVSSLIKKGATSLFFLTLSGYDPQIKRYLDAQALLNNIAISGIFADNWFVYREEISLFAEGAIGSCKVSRAASPLSSGKAYEKIFYEF